jgi:hypothetical protein
MPRGTKSKSSENGRTEHGQGLEEWTHNIERSSDKDPYSLPFDEFVRYVLDRTEWYPDPDHWSSPLFEFTRWMNGRGELRGLEACRAAMLIDQSFKRIEGGTEALWEDMFPGLLTGDPRAEFIDTWPKIKTPANMDALQLAFRAAHKLPLRPMRVMSSKYCKLISIAGHLQQSRPGEPIALPVERLGDLIKIDRKFIGKYLKFATSAELLRKTSDSVAHRRAAEFMFASERFNWKTGDQIN